MSGAGAIEESYEFCDRLARREARNFYPSFLLLPADRRRSMCALYAFMRHTDDIADEPGSAGSKRQALDAWRIELGRTLDGEGFDWPGLEALAETVRRHEIPLHYLHEVIDGVALDVEPRPFATFDELHAYCYKVASVVGLCCLHIWGFDSDGGRAEALAESCGLALQLTNILRDVREDARAGRIYLPQEDLDRFGVAPADLDADRPSPALRALLEFEGNRALDCYREAAPLVGLVAPVGRPVLLALVGIYRALLDAIIRRDYDVLGRRVAVPGWKKGAIVLGALARGKTGFTTKAQRTQREIKNEREASEFPI
ncbi:MAG TPA: phytoene/squalene synthase family protein [Isosphaeraceae bacterium]|nr:phytoene/squalene synthase family protein [Isosphaeraceae bacterium]